MLLVIYWSKRKRLHKKRVQLLHDCYGRRFIETPIETLPSDNSDANKNVAVKNTLRRLRLFSP